MLLHTCLLLSAVSTSFAHHVLVVAPVPSRSHGTLAKGIVQSLLDAGHQVTWVSPFTDWKPHKNLKLIKVDTLNLVQHMDMTEKANADLSVVQAFARNITDMTIQTPAVRDAVTKGKFDAVVTEWFFSETDAGFAAVLQVPWILLSGMVMMPQTQLLVEDVHSLATIPFIIHDFPVPMSFWQRAVNTMSFVAMFVGMRLELPSVTARYESYFASIAAARGVPLPPFQEAHNIAILLINSHPSIAPEPSLPANAIDIAGYHIDEVQPLPKDIQEILDASSNGVVYFSMGSVLKSSQLPLDLRRELIQVLSELPYTVLWKFEEDIQGLPRNVIVRKWWPQNSVLAHPNVKLFITHSGMLSCLEAIHHGVPLLAVPVFGDQPSNAARAVRAGYARRVPYSETMAPELRQALKEMTADDSYYKQAKYLSKLFNSRPVHPRKLISHYIELAIESKGAPHLRSKSFLYPWYQRWLVDQLAALTAALLAVYWILKRLFRVLVGGTPAASKGKKAKRS